MAKINILLVDDHKLIRQTWKYLLEKDLRFTVIEDCGNAEIAIDLANNLKPDIILMDINIGPINGFIATERIVNLLLNSRVIAISVHNEPSYAVRMLEIGAYGYISKNSTWNEVCEAIVNVHSGRRYICSETRNLLPKNSLSGVPKPISGIYLTHRELEIIDYIRQGFSSREIGVKMRITMKTVEVHRYNILKKLNLKNTASLVHFMRNNPYYA
jgi:DNA-binding NarL/FixJ family response regulator